MIPQAFIAALSMLGALIAADVLWALITSED